MLLIRPSRNVVIGLILVAVILLGVLGFTYLNQASKLYTLEKQIKDKEQKLADSEKIAKRLSAAEQDNQLAQAMLSALEQGVSTRAYVPTLLRQLEDLGKSVNLRIVGVRPRAEQERAVRRTNGAEGEGKNAKEETKKPEPYDKLDIDIEITGKYWDAMSFIHKLTSFPKIMAVRDVQISPIGQSEGLGSPSLSVRLSTTAFILKQPAVKISGAKKAAPTPSVSKPGGGEKNE